MRRASQFARERQYSLDKGLREAQIALLPTLPIWDSGQGALQQEGSPEKLRKCCILIRQGEVLRCGFPLLSFHVAHMG